MQHRKRRAYKGRKHRKYLKNFRVHRYKAALCGLHQGNLLFKSHKGKYSLIWDVLQNLKENCFSWTNQIKQTNKKEAAAFLQENKETKKKLQRWHCSLSSYRSEAEGLLLGHVPQRNQSVSRPCSAVPHSVLHNVMVNLKSQKLHEDFLILIVLLVLSSSKITKSSATEGEGVSVWGSWAAVVNCSSSTCSVHCIGHFLQNSQRPGI